MNFLILAIYALIFIVIMVFVFSAGLLTPMIGKKNIAVVGVLGFIIGVVCGSFLITPIYQELPYMVGNIHSFVDPNHETLKVSVSSKNDLNQSIEIIRHMKGFRSLKEAGFKLITTPFSKDRKKYIENYLSQKKYDSYEVDTNGTITIFTNKEFNLNEVNDLSHRLDYTGAVTTQSSSVYYSVNVNAGDVTEDTNNFSKGAIIIESVTGPVQDTIIFVKSILFDDRYVLLITGIIGLFAALIGSFWDTITEFIRKFWGTITEFIRKIRRKS